MSARAVLAASLALTPAGHGIAQSSAPLAGLWGSDRVFGPTVSGMLTITSRSSGTTARIAGFRVPVITVLDTVRFELPRQQGTFRGTWRNARRDIAGFWVQPATIVDGVPFATPVRLRQTASGVWSGDVAPLVDRVSLYMNVARARDGSWVAFFRNPERNLRGGAETFSVTMHGDRVSIADPKHAATRYEATYDARRDQILLPWPALGVTLQFTRRSRDEAPGYYARASGPPYRYRAPASLDDGWTTATLASVGMNADAISALVNRLAGADASAPAAPTIQSLLIARHGKLALEEYFFGFNAGRPHDLRSASKTISGLMIGTAADHGAPVAPSTRLVTVLPAYARLFGSDARKNGITIAHLMTMSSGLACDDNDDASPGNEDRMQSQSVQRDWYAFTLALPMAAAPGTRYAYCSAGVNLLGAALHTTTRTWLPALFDEEIAEPLQIEQYHINLAPGGDAYLGGGMRMLPRDLLKIGQLFLDDGMWNGHRVVSKQWVDESLVRRIVSSSSKPQSWDGYDWHSNDLHVGTKVYREYEANGNGGQFLILLPELDMSVVFTADNYGQYGTWRRFRDEIVPQIIIPAVTTP